MPKYRDKYGKEVEDSWINVVVLNWILLFVLVSIFVLLIYSLFYRWLRKFSLNREIEGAVPKTFLTSFDTEQRYNNISYHCNLLSFLLDLNEDYANYYHYFFSGSAFAYRSVLRKRFLDLFDYLLEILKMDLKHYIGIELCKKEFIKLRTCLEKSFVCRFHHLKTYDALDSFAEYSETLIHYLLQINDECKAMNNQDTELYVDRMLINIQLYYDQYKSYIGIRKKVYKITTTSGYGDHQTRTTVYYTLGHSRCHFIDLLKQYVLFINNYYKNMQMFYEKDTIAPQ